MVIKLKSISKYKIDIFILLCILIFAIISVVTIGSSEKLLINSNNLVFRQILWYIIGFIFVFFTMFI